MAIGSQISVPDGQSKFPSLADRRARTSSSNRPEDLRVPRMSARNKITGQKLVRRSAPSDGALPHRARPSSVTPTLPKSGRPRHGNALPASALAGRRRRPASRLNTNLHLMHSHQRLIWSPPTALPDQRPRELAPGRCVQPPPRRAGDVERSSTFALPIGVLVGSGVSRAMARRHDIRYHRRGECGDRNVVLHVRLPPASLLRGRRCCCRVR